jgi:hypothetical protein
VADNFYGLVVTFAAAWAVPEAVSSRVLCASPLGNG